MNKAQIVEAVKEIVYGAKPETFKFISTQKTVNPVPAEEITAHLEEILDSGSFMSAEVLDEENSVFLVANVESCYAIVSPELISVTPIYEGEGHLYLSATKTLAITGHEELFLISVEDPTKFEKTYTR